MNVISQGQVVCWSAVSALSTRRFQSTTRIPPWTTTFTTDACRDIRANVVQNHVFAVKNSVQFGVRACQLCENTVVRDQCVIVMQENKMQYFYSSVASSIRSVKLGLQQTADGTTCRQKLRKHMSIGHNCDGCINGRDTTIAFLAL